MRGRKNEEAPSQCFIFIEDYIAKNGSSPSYEEIKMHVGLKSKHQVSDYIRELEGDGLLRRLPNRRRAIEILVPTLNAKDPYAETQKLIDAMDIPPPPSLTPALFVSKSLRECSTKTVVPSVAVEGHQ